MNIKCQVFTEMKRKSSFDIARKWNFSLKSLKHFRIFQRIDEKEKNKMFFIDFH